MDLGITKEFDVQHFTPEQTLAYGGFVLAAVAGCLLGLAVYRLAYWAGYAVATRLGTRWHNYRVNKRFREWRVDRIVREHNAEVATLREQNSTEEWDRILRVFTDYDQPAA